jgi:hypothetical protein
MDIETAVKQIEAWARSDWIGLWEIVAYVSEDLGDEVSEEQQLALIVSVVNQGPRFVPWRNQDPDAVAALISRGWWRSEEFPSWSDGPWFTVARLCRLDA